MSDERPTVGLIGLGHMGAAMCRTLLRSGWTVVAWNRDRARLEAAVAAGAQAASDPAEVLAAARDVVISVSDIEALREITFGASGLVHGGGSERLVVDTSTISPADARSLSSDLADRGVGYIDAPVSGGVRGAEAGDLAVMVGGEPEQVERARPVLESIGSLVIHFGAVGAGQVAKACNQLVVMSTLEAVAEAMVLARAGSLDPWRIREVLMAGYAASTILDVQGPRMIERDFTPGGRTIFHLKDIATIAQIADGAGLDLPAFMAAARQVEQLVASGGGDLDHAALITLLDP